MRPFSAWLAMSLVHKGRPLKLVICEIANSAALFTNRRKADSVSAGPPQRVLIIEDTEENRRKLGMEEGS